MASTRADFIWEEPRLGAGSFGEVHRVRRRADGGTYVIKTIGSLSRADQDASLNEVRLLASVDHPRVVRCSSASQVELQREQNSERATREQHQREPRGIAARARAPARRVRRQNRLAA